MASPWTLYLVGGWWDGHELGLRPGLEPQRVLYAWACEAGGKCEGHFDFDAQCAPLDRVLAYVRDEVDEEKGTALYVLGDLGPTDEREEWEFAAAGRDAVTAG